MADSLLFDGVDDAITLAFGADLFPIGRGTIAAIVKKSSDGAHSSVFQVGATDANRYLLHINNTNVFALYNSGTVPNPSTLSLTVADGWALIAASKEVGTVTPRFHKYVFATSAWTHADGSGTVADGLLPVTSAFLGRSTALFFAGNILLAGAWNSVLSDSDFETLDNGLQAWYDLAPRELWRLDRMDQIRSLIGPESCETSRTGTTVDTGDAPAGWDDTLVKRSNPPFPAPKRLRRR